MATVSEKLLFLLFQTRDKKRSQFLAKAADQYQQYFIQKTLNASLNAAFHARIGLEPLISLIALACSREIL